MDAVIGLANTEGGFLMLLDPETNELRLRAARNFEKETLQRKDMEVNRTVINPVMQNGAGLVATDAQSNPRFADQDSVITYALRSIMCALLCA